MFVISGGGGGSPGGGFDTHNNNNHTFTSYSFHGDPRATFAEFFGTENPFANIFNLGGILQILIKVYNVTPIDI